jgi:hypothetical protein
MSLDNYKTNINGSNVSLNEIFSSASANSNSSVRDQFKVGGSSVLKGNSFSNALNQKLTTTTFSIPGYDHDDRSSERYTTAPADWGYNPPIRLAHAGFDDKQSNVGYKKNGDDIGPLCCATYIDYPAERSEPIFFPTWVDYFKVIAVGEGGNKGNGRNKNTDNYAQGGTGTSGGFIAFKSASDLGNRRIQAPYTYYQIDTPATGSIRFSVYERGALISWCRADKGYIGASPRGGGGAHNDDDTTANSIKAAGRSTSQSDLTSYFSGTAYLQRFITGNPCTAHYNTPNYASNIIGDIVNGWDNYGKGQDWKSNTSTTADLGAAFIRVYYIGYAVS